MFARKYLKTKEKFYLIDNHLLKSCYSINTRPPLILTANCSYRQAYDNFLKASLFLRYFIASSITFRSLKRGKKVLPKPIRTFKKKQLNDILALMLSGKVFLALANEIRAFHSNNSAIIKLTNTLPLPIFQEISSSLNNRDTVTVNVTIISKSPTWIIDTFKTIKI